MTRARYYKTIFIPDLTGQVLLWKNDVLPIVKRIDEIVQLGNIISVNDYLRDAETNGVNEKLLRYILLWRSSFEGWTQLVGPNEIMALNYPSIWTNNNSEKILRDNWLMSESKWGRFHTAAVNKRRLVTHGGLTYGTWVDIGRPQTPEEAAEKLNKRYDKTLWQGESFKLNGVPCFSADPIFADPISEVYPSWITAKERCPFPQVHSAGGFNTHDGYQAASEVFSSLPYVDDVKYTNFGSIAKIKGTDFTSIYIELPRGRIVEHVPKPWHFPIEKVPVLDTREHLFAPLRDEEGKIIPYMGELKETPDSPRSIIFKKEHEEAKKKKLEELAQQESQ